MAVTMPLAKKAHAGPIDGNKAETGHWVNWFARLVGARWGNHANRDAVIRTPESTLEQGTFDRPEAPA
jgi:hypothetical protein